MKIEIDRGEFLTNSEKDALGTRSRLRTSMETRIMRENKPRLPTHLLFEQDEIL